LRAVESYSRRASSPARKKRQTKRRFALPAKSRATGLSKRNSQEIFRAANWDAEAARKTKKEEERSKSENCWERRNSGWWQGRPYGNIRSGTAERAAQR
jgi:hypothetical protein